MHNRSKGKGCPYCSGRLSIIGVNDFQTMAPEIAAEWDITKNATLRPQDVRCGSNVKVWWICSICGNEWEASVNGRTGRGAGCPKCAEAKKGSQRKSHEVFEKQLKRINPNIGLIGKYHVSTEKVKCLCLKCQTEWEALP